MYWLLLILIIIVMIYLYDRKNKSYWHDKKVKQTNASFLFGDNLKLMLRKISIVDFFSEIYHCGKNHRFVGFYQFLEPCLLLRDPELIKQMIVKDFDHFVDRKQFGPENTDPMWESNLFALKGAKWRKMRSTLSASFTSSKMKYIFHVLKEGSERFISNFENPNKDIMELNLKDTFLRYTNDIIATVAFGVEVDSIRNKKNEFFLMGTEVMKTLSGGSFIKMFIFIALPRLVKLLGITLIAKKCSNFFINLVKTTIKYREDNDIVRPDMLNLLIEARNGIHKKDDTDIIDTGFATVNETHLEKPLQNISLTDQEIAAQCLIFFLAGFETVSTVMSFLSYELAVNQDIQDKLREEINQTIKLCNDTLTYEVLMKMKYLDMVVSEALRKYPNATVLNRVCTKEYKIQPLTPDERPVVIPRDMQVVIPIYCIQRDPDYYHNPDKFDPERFNDENKHNIRPYTYMPFGSGPRNCIASRFALLETKTLFFYLLSKFRIVPTKKSKIPFEYTKKSFQMAPEDGFWFGFQPL